MEATLEKPESAILSAPFSVYGGKKYLAGKLVPLIPQHRTYVEPFMGAASVLFAKARSPVEILSDVDDEKVRMLVFLRDHSADSLSALAAKNWAPSAEQFWRVKALIPKNEIDLVYRGLYLRWNSFGQRCDSWSVNTAAAQSGRYMVVRAPIYRHRLKGVDISCRDWTRAIRETDAPDTFFYIDPPYIGTSNDRAEHFQEPSAKELLHVLSRVKGKWLMSNSVHRSLSIAFCDYFLYKVKVPTQVDQVHGHSQRLRTEYLISNYRLQK